MDCRLLSYLAQVKQKNFTGKLNINASFNQKFQIYFYLGRLLWADGGFHPNRAWQRYIDKYCPHIDFQSLSLPALERFEYWKYYLLTILYEENFCDKEKLIDFINNRITEVIFDIFFAEYHYEIEYKAENITYSHLHETGFKNTIALLDIKTVIQKTEQEWWSWQDNQFQNFHPDLVPLIIDREQLDRSIYLNFSKKKIEQIISHINGQNSLRDIAVTCDLYLLESLYCLIPYVRDNAIELIETPDKLPIETSTGSLLSNLFQNQKDNFNFSDRIKLNRQPIVACLDNDLKAIEAIETIVTKCGYKFIAIQDPIGAIEVIFKIQPDVFFINSKLPEFDSYTLATKLRKIAQFKNSPIFLLSNNKCRENRLKAKIIGINEILEKPLRIAQLFTEIDKSLSSFDRTDFEYNLRQDKMEEVIALIASSL